jgi:hypothetical protein
MAIREDMNRLLVIHAHIRERRVPRTNVSGNQRKPALELGLAVTRHDDKRHALALKAIEGESPVRIGSEVRAEILLTGRE